MTRLFFVPVNTRPTPPQFSLLSACTGVVIRSRRIPLMRCEYSYRRTARGVRGPGCQNSASTVSQTTIGLTGSVFAGPMSQLQPPAYSRPCACNYHLPGFALTTGGPANGRACWLG